MHGCLPPRGRCPPSLYRALASERPTNRDCCMASRSSLIRTFRINTYSQHLASRPRTTSIRRHDAVTDAPSLSGRCIMFHRTTEEVRAPTTFGRRKVRPRVCVADGKQHIRTFLREALEELDFIVCEC